MAPANQNLRLVASEAPRGVSSLNFDGRPSDWSAVAFEVEDVTDPLHFDQKLFCLAIMVLASIPFVFVGACAASLLGA